MMPPDMPPAGFPTEPIVDTQGMTPTQRFIIQIGVVSALLGYLVFWVTGRVEGRVNHIEDMLNRHVVATDAIIDKLDDQLANQRIQISVTQQVCLALGKSAADRRACISATSGTR